jgi:hypothetical protein
MTAQNAIRKSEILSPSRTTFDLSFLEVLRPRQKFPFALNLPIAAERDWDLSASTPHCKFLGGSNLRVPSTISAKQGIHNPPGTSG